MHDRVKATTKQETERAVPTTSQNMQEPEETRPCYNPSGQRRGLLQGTNHKIFYPAKSLKFTVKRVNRT